MTTDFTPIDDLTGPGEARSTMDTLAGLFPDAVVDGRIDLDVLRDLLGDDAEPAGTEAFGLRWPGMSEARRLSTLPPTGTLLPRPDESVNWDETKNIVIEGDNLEVLRLLRRGYTNKVDVIYIDPPYNTGNDFVYDDSRMSTVKEYETEAGLRDEDGATQAGEGSDRAQDRRAGASKHAKWLSMMYPRLLVAQQLLKDTGVIFAAIDDTEHARVKLLFDRVFGSENFAANIVWQGVGKNDARFTAGGLDYMLVYAKNLNLLVDNDVRWVEPKKGYQSVLDAASDAWNQSGHKPTTATEIFKKWWRSKPDTEKGLSAYSEIDETGHAYTRSPISSPNYRANLIYDVYHPVSGGIVPTPPNGWRYSREVMATKLESGRVLFGRTHVTPVRYKRYLHETESQIARPMFFQVRSKSSEDLRGLLGEDVFNHPKDIDVLARWINILTNASPQATVLDFFAGSGSTGHAVMDLNAADGGRRRYMLVQLDEALENEKYATIADIMRERLRRAGRLVGSAREPEAPTVDVGFRSYRLASSNINPWDGSVGQLDLLSAVDNLVEGRSTDDFLVETMLRLGVELTTPVEQRDVAGSPLYNLGGTLYAYFGTDVTTERANEIARAVVDWRDQEPVDSDVTVVVRDTGFVDSSAKLNLAAALDQAGITTLRSI